MAVTSLVFGVGISGMHGALFVEAGGLDSAANRGTPIDSRDEDL
jgi:hypothetical protein